MTVPMPFAEISPGWHLYRDGQEMHCHKLKLTDDECDWYSGWWHNWYTADWAYALPVVYFFCATIGVLSVLHWMHVIGCVVVSRTMSEVFTLIDSPSPALATNEALGVNDLQPGVALFWVARLLLPDGALPT